MNLQRLRLTLYLTVLPALTAIIAVNLALDVPPEQSAISWLVAVAVAVTAIELALTYVRSGSRRLETLRALSLELPSVRSAREFYDLLTRVASRDLGARAGVFLSRQEPDAPFEVVHHFGLDGREHGPMPAGETLPPPPDRPAIVPLTGDDPWFGPMAGRRGYNVIAHVPATSRGEPVGFVIILAGGRTALLADADLLREIGALVGAVLEIGQLVLREEHLGRRFRRLDDVRSDFLARIAHELRTPLTSLRTSFDLLTEESRGQASPQQRQLLEGMGRGIERLQTLTNDLVEFERLRLDQLSITREPIAIREVVQSAMSLISPLVVDRKQSLLIDVPPDGLRVDVDRRRIEQVLLNLLANGHAYAGEGGSIAVRAWEEQGNAIIEVSDSGPGIPEAESDAVFEPFYRGDRAPQGGAGLGLAISRSLVELHGGRIWVTSAPGQGARFCVSLPLAGAPASEGAD